MVKKKTKAGKLNPLKAIKQYKAALKHLSSLEKLFKGSKYKRLKAAVKTYKKKINKYIKDAAKLKKMAKPKKRVKKKTTKRKKKSIKRRR